MPDPEIEKEPMTSVSLRASEEYALAVKQVAFAEGFETVGDFVRDSLDKANGRRLQEQIAVIVAKRGEKVPRLGGSTESVPHG